MVLPFWASFGGRGGCGWELEVICTDDDETVEGNMEGTVEGKGCCVGAMLGAGSDGTDAVLLLFAVAATVGCCCCSFSFSRKPLAALRKEC